jgi:S1-C subfamily serine protease
MAHFRLSLFAASLLAFALVMAAPAVSQAAQAEPRRTETKDGTQAKDDGAKSEKDAEEMISAVVRVKMKAIAGARSNSSLGSTRDGTGVVIDEKGHIVTIGYIVIEADSIEVTTEDGRTVPATLVGYDHATGFGLLRSTVPLKVKPMTLGDPAQLEVRDPVMILPAGGREAATFAYVVSRRSFAGSWEYMLDSAIFTSPPTMQWAGAALVDRDGKLVGVGSLLVRDTIEPGSPLPGNMFVPVDILKPILPDLIAKGRRAGSARPWLGLATESAQGRLFVTRVSPDSPADRAGIRAGDILLGVGAEAVKNHEELYNKMWSIGPAGVDVPLRVLQGADVRDVKVHSIDRFEYFKEKPTY